MSDNHLIKHIEKRIAPIGLKKEKQKVVNAIVDLLKERGAESKIADACTVKITRNKFREVCLCLEIGYGKYDDPDRWLYVKIDDETFQETGIRFELGEWVTLTEETMGQMRKNFDPEIAKSFEKRAYQIGEIEFNNSGKPELKWTPYNYFLEGSDGIRFSDYNLRTATASEKKATLMHKLFTENAQRWDFK